MAQRDKLIGELGELEAAERVLARYSKGTRAWKGGFGQRPDHINQTSRSGAIAWAAAHKSCKAG